MEKDIREAIIEMIERKRYAMYNYNGLEACPFEQRCNLCAHIFPEWGKSFAEENMRRRYGGSTTTHPCWTYGEDYVLGEMKRLFPELY
jgi:hypothetical protein